VPQSRRLALILVLLGAVLIGAPGTAVLAQAVQPGQDEFVPIDQLPPEDRLPAAPLLIAAYGFVWVALLGYLWSVWRRVQSVEREVRDVGRRLSERRE
jgi:CcmD family protein